jgi:hypothetical protein
MINILHPILLRVIKPLGVAGEMINAYKILGIHHVRDLVVGQTIILRVILRGGGVWSCGLNSVGSG